MKTPTKTTTPTNLNQGLPPATPGETGLPDRPANAPPPAVDAVKAAETQKAEGEKATTEENALQASIANEAQALAAARSQRETVPGQSAAPVVPNMAETEAAAELVERNRLAALERARVRTVVSDDPNHIPEGFGRPIGPAGSDPAPSNPAGPVGFISAATRAEQEAGAAVLAQRKADYQAALARRDERAAERLQEGKVDGSDLDYAKR